MPTSNRIRVSASYNYFIREINRLERFDNQNQRNFIAGRLSNAQLALLAESIFFTGFRAYEGFVREVFLLYSMGKRPRNNAEVISYINPKNFLHSEQLIKSSMKFLDWNSPDVIIERAELFLQNGYPIKLPYTTNLISLRDYKKLRNHIAHDSMETLDEYKKVLRNYYTIIPLTIPAPGEYLLLPSKVNAQNYLLIDFFGLMKKIAFDLT